MTEKPVWFKLLERLDNFYGDYTPIKELAYEDEDIYCALHDIYLLIQKEASMERKGHGNKREEKLKMILTKTYELAVRRVPIFKNYFNEDDSIHADLFDACSFTVLSMFIHNSKHIKAMSLSKFVYENSPKKYNVPGSENYYPYESTDDRLIKEVTRLRKLRNRLFADRDVYDTKQRWSLMRKDSVHEWKLCYTLNDEEKEQFDAFKRIKTLYNDLKRASGSDKGEGYPDRVAEAFKKFESKLDKFKYEKYINLFTTIKDYLSKDKRYSGMNIYRLEKSFRFWSLTHEVNTLLDCKSEEDENRALLKFYALTNIHYPKLYKAFSLLDNTCDILNLLDYFWMFLQNYTIYTWIILDYSVESEYFGNDWETFILDTINSMTETVFYDPETLDTTIRDGAQDKFKKILLSPFVRQSKPDYFDLKDDDSL